MTGRGPRLLAAAFAAADRGWPVFPVAPYGKRPAITGWPERATCDPDQLAAWWRHAPYNIGVSCGPAGLLVIDLDQPHQSAQAPPEEWATEGVRDGRDVLAVLARRGGHPEPVDTYTVATPLGEQRYFTVAAVDRARARSTAGALGWLVDTRGAGGYVIAAGSVRRVGGHRRYYRRTSRPDTPVAFAPGWLLDALTRPKPPCPAHLAQPVRRPDAYARAALNAEARQVHQAQPGTRNTTLFHAARRLGQLAAAGALDEQHVAAALTQAATRHVGVEGFTAGEAAATIHNGLRYGRRHPRPAQEAGGRSPCP